MLIANVSEKGQVTIPSDIRRKAGIAPRSRVEITLEEEAVVIRPLRSISDVIGIFKDCTGGKPMDWERVREEMEIAVAEQVAHE